MKKFLVIANHNCITYKKFFPMIKEGTISLGYHKPKEYDKPDGTVAKQGNDYWFTNLYVEPREPIILTKTYTPGEYPTYDNYDAINVDRTKNIPYDYDGVMGVPITFLDHYSPEQFEIIGLFGNFNPKDCTPETAFICGSDVSHYNLPGTQNGGVIITKNGPTALYKRIFIRRKK